MCFGGRLATYQHSDTIIFFSLIYPQIHSPDDEGKKFK